MIDRLHLLIADPAPIVREGLKASLSRDPSIAVCGEVSDCPGLRRACTDSDADVVLFSPALPEGCVSAVIQENLQGPRPARWVQWGPDSPADSADRNMAGVTTALATTATPEEIARVLREAHRGKPKEGQAARMPRSLTASPLTSREIEVLRRTLHGYSRKQTADDLGIQIKTVDVYRRNIMEKLEVGNMVELVIYALRSGMLSLEDFQSMA